MGEGQTLSRRSASRVPRRAPLRLPRSRPRWRCRSVRAHASARTEFLIPRQNIGIQLYSVRDRAEADLPETLAMLAEIGYTEVEPFSYHGRTPAQFRALLDANGLHAVGFHVGADRFRNELDTVLDEAELLGQQYVGASFVTLPGDPNINLTAYRRFAREFNAWGEAAAERGLRFYFHNHSWDFTVSRGRVLYDVLLEETDDDFVFFELDLYWIITAGFNPIKYLQALRPGPLAAVPRQGSRRRRQLRRPRHRHDRLRPDLQHPREQALPPLPRRARHPAGLPAHRRGGLRVPADAAREASQEGGTPTCVNRSPRQVSALLLLALPSMAAGQTPPIGGSLPEGGPRRHAGRADEPRRAARPARAAHDAARRAADLQPAERAQHGRGDVRRLQARRGGPAERRDRRELRGQPLGLRVLLASAATRRWTIRRTPVTNEGDAPFTGTPADFAPFKGVIRLSRFKLERSKLDMSTEQQIIDVPVDRGICCHVGGNIDFDSQGNLYLSTGDDTNPFFSDGYAPLDDSAGPQPGLRRAAHRRQHQRPPRQAAAHPREVRRRLLDPVGQPVPAGHGEDPSRDLRDGAAEPVPLRRQPQQRRRVPGRLLAGRPRLPTPIAGRRARAVG